MLLSELLSILLQSDTDTQRQLGELKLVRAGSVLIYTCRVRTNCCCCHCCCYCYAQGEADGVESLLLVVSGYRKRDPEDVHEEEFVENTFNCVCAALVRLPGPLSANWMQVHGCCGVQALTVSFAIVFQSALVMLLVQLVPENQQRFLAAEGFELMVRIMREKVFARHCAVKVVELAVARSPAACSAFVAVDGLKTIFPFFMGKVRCGVVPLDACVSAHFTSPNSATIMSAEFPLFIRDS